MPDGSLTPRERMRLQLEELNRQHREKFLAEAPELSAEELEAQHRDLERQAREEKRARAQYKPRASSADQAKLTRTLPMWDITQAKPNITAAELRVYAVLRIRARPGRPRVQIARSELAKVANVSDRHVLRCLYELAAAGLIKPWEEGARISRTLSETNTYELEEAIAWPRVTDRPAVEHRAARRRRYDTNVTPSGCPTDTFRSAPVSETPEGGAGIPESGRAPPGAAPALGNSTDRRLAPPGALAEGRTRKRRASPAPAILATGAERDPRVIELEELLESPSSRSTTEDHHDHPDAGAG